jgi:hypothetical protein
MLFGQLTTWLAGELDQEQKQAVVEATLGVLAILNEQPWDSSSGWSPNTWAHLLFPSIQWVSFRQACVSQKRYPCATQ